MQEFINSYWQPALYSLLVFIVARLCNKLWIAVATMVIKQNLYEKAPCWPYCMIAYSRPARITLPKKGLVQKS